MPSQTTMNRLPSLLLCVAALVLPASAQSTAATPTPTVASTTTAAASGTSSTSYSGVPNLILRPTATYGVCSPGRLTWNLYNEDPSLYEITIRAINIGIAQSIPPAASSTSSSAVSASAAAISTSATSSVAPTSAPSSAATTTTAAAAAAATTSHATSATSASLIARHLAPRASGVGSTNRTIYIGSAAQYWYFDALNLEEGRWYFEGSINDTRGTYMNTAVVSVVNNGSTACLSTVSNSSTSTGSSARSSATGSSAADSAGSSGSSGISGGAIGGIVAGVVVALLVAGLLACFCLRKRRRAAQGQRMISDPYDVQKMTHSEKPLNPAMRAMDKYGASSQGSTGSVNPIAMGELKSDSGHSQSSQRSGAEFGNLTDDDASGSPPTTAVLAAQQTTPKHSPMTRSTGQVEAGTSDSNPFATPQATPMTAFRDPFTSPRLAYGDEEYASRRVSGPPSTSPRQKDALKRSSSGMIGIGMEVLRDRSNSQPSAEQPERPRQGSSQNGTPNLGRSGSSRRKPVPSLGPELRQQLDRERVARASSEDAGAQGYPRGQVTPGSTPQQQQRNFSLVPDLPPAPSQ